MTKRKFLRSEISDMQDLLLSDKRLSQVASHHTSHFTRFSGFRFVILKITEAVGVPRIHRAFLLSLHKWNVQVASSAVPVILVA
ncbi:hypothetical protein YC2023_081417 [Brassica napus]